ncbi:MULTISPECIES: hypothetical protein [Achromobacter]|uniref:DUF2846 domain-containing protein n=1 Tax=Achromobacter aegrifaciens TaxID=1287736 RepID=A0ABU2DAF6_ACHAE|nr:MULTISPECIES: hypothetical protein [Achromobacter]MBD9476138.1 hypothetical protein [Achromobacter sp. ACM01]MDR7945022.1 hypothetical protein [Achromobacter aegrifaciens]CAB3866998.1 hypothetical protein LMG26854_03777 [Achromobacter aegrifaciens]CAB3926941.1 hypothetical protein LMG3410_06071 [Achromobacter aegrifaciens]
MQKFFFVRSRYCGVGAAILTLAMLVGCTTAGQSSARYSVAALDPAKGVVVGTVFERAVFVPYGAYFYLQSSDGKRIMLESGGGGGKPAIVNNPPKVPKGVGSTFALQLAPGKYQITRWALDYGRRIKVSEGFAQAIEFEVIPGQIAYLGRLDASRFLEVASIHDNYAEDLPYLKTRHPSLESVEIVNRSLRVQGWWLPDPTGKAILERTGGGTCDQC